MDFGKRNKKERDSLSVRDTFDDWYSTPFDQFSSARPMSMRHWLREVEETMNRQLETLMREAEKGENGKGPIVYGWSLKVVDGKPEFREFGNVIPNTSREPVFDVLSNDNEITVVVELPGVEKNEINVEAAATELSIETTGTRKYKKNAELPDEIDPSSVTSTFNNGVLEVKARKTGNTKRRVSVL